MTKSEIEAVLERVKAWPEHRQEDLASIVLEIERQGIDLYVLSDEERADLDEALEEERRGEFANEEEVRAVFARYR